jgi:glyoxylase-like metal-dependent hydrolase (beta-lactamase superfamily II)
VPVFKTIALIALLACAPGAHAKAAAMRVLQINDHLTAFYDGRPAESSVDQSKATWADHGANYVGVATYVIHSGDSALVYDAYPSTAQAAWVRDYMTRAGVRHFTLVNSHWHLDHVGGNAVYADSPSIATEKTRERLIANKAGIEAGTVWGLPGIAPLRVPDIGITADTIVTVGTVRVELHPVAIHSEDGLVILLPQDRLLLAGDTLEDTMTFVAEPESLPAQYATLLAMKGWGFDHILPNHGNPDVIARGGYTPALIDMTRHYIRSMVEHAHDADYLRQPIEAHIGSGIANGTVSLWWAYREAHQENLGKIAEYYKDKPLPSFGPAEQAPAG